MAITTPVYATREAVKRALDIRETARANEQVDRLLEASARSIDGSLHRKFYPRIATLKRDWIASRSPIPWRLWLDANELISVSALVSGGVTVPPTDYILYPSGGPPYNRIEIDLSGPSAFSTGSTHQNAISITGMYGYTLDLQAIGGLTSAIDSSVAAIGIPNGALVGVGDLLRIGSEFVLVIERGWTDSTQNLQSPALTASAANTSVAVTDGSDFNVGETVLLDSEKMLITDVAGNSLSVKRTWDGSVLAAHTGSDIYVSRALTVTRPAVGSTATSHLIGAAVNRWVPSPLLTQLNIAETLASIEQEQSAYARVVGSGDAAFEARGVGLLDIRDRACTALGRKGRHRAI